MVLKFQNILEDAGVDWNVSVPLRGCGFEITVDIVEMMKFFEFPSPCGDVVLKYNSDPYNIMTQLFPSPCGDVVLKLLIPTIHHKTH